MDFEPRLPGLSDQIENAADRLPDWLFPALYWAAFVFVALLFVLSSGPFALIGVAAPVLLVLAVRRRGLDGTPPLLYGVAVLALCWAGFFMALYYRNLDGSKPLVLVGAVGFIVAVRGFARVLGRADRRYRERGQLGASDLADHRLVLIGLILATLVLAVTMNAGAVVCLLALVWRRRWTAVTAAVVSVLAGSLSYVGGFRLDPVGAVVGVLAAWEWVKASRNPYWYRW